MNSTFAVISTLVKSNIGEKCLINFLMNMSTKYFLECASIYKGRSPKKKTDLIEMIVYVWQKHFIYLNPFIDAFKTKRMKPIKLFASLMLPNKKVMPPIDNYSFELFAH